MGRFYCTRQQQLGTGSLNFKIKKIKTTYHHHVNFKTRENIDKINCSWCVPLDHSSLCNSLIDILTHLASGMEPSYVPCTYVPLLFITYSRVHKSSDSFFSKILEKPSIVQKKMRPHIKGLDFSQR